MEGLAEVSGRGKLDWESHIPAEPCSKTLPAQGRPAVSINSWHSVKPRPDVLEDTCSTQTLKIERGESRQAHICLQHQAAELHARQIPLHENKAALQVSETTKSSRQTATVVKDEAAEPVASHESQCSYRIVLGESGCALATSQAQGTESSGRKHRAADSQPTILSDQASDDSEHVSSASLSSAITSAN